MSDQDGRYRYSRGEDPERTQVDRAWTEDFGEYKVGEPHSMDDDDFGPVERSGLGRTQATPRAANHGAARRIDPAEHTRTEARYEETGYVSSSGQAYERDPRFDGVPARQGSRSQGRIIEEDDQPSGFSMMTLILASVAALTVGVVGTILFGGLGGAKSSTPTAITTIDPNAATPQQVTELNNQIAQLTKTVQERDAQIHNIQTELDKVRQESAAHNAAATSASQQAAQAEKRKADLDAREAELAKRAKELETLANQLKEREQQLQSQGAGGSNPIEDAANGVVDQAAGAASEGINSLIDQIRQSVNGQ